jgi:hypothetical protein
VSAAAETCFGDTVALTLTMAADHRAASAGSGLPSWSVSVGLRATTHGTREITKKQENELMADGRITGGIFGEFAAVAF